MCINHYTYRENPAFLSIHGNPLGAFAETVQRLPILWRVIMSLHKFLPSLTLLALMMLGTVSIADAQLREDLARPGEYTGAIIKTDNSGSPTLNSLMESINM